MKRLIKILVSFVAVLSLSGLSIPCAKAQGSSMEWLATIAQTAQDLSFDTAKWTDIGNQIINADIILNRFIKNDNLKTMNSALSYEMRMVTATLRDIYWYGDYIRNYGTYAEYLSITQHIANLSWYVYNIYYAVVRDWTTIKQASQSSKDAATAVILIAQAEKKRDEAAEKIAAQRHKAVSSACKTVAKINDRQLVIANAKCQSITII